MSSATPDVLTLGAFIAGHLRRLGPVPVDAHTLAVAIENQFLITPAADLVPIELDFEVPVEMVEDQPTFTGYMRYRIRELIADTAEGFVALTERPVLHRLPDLQHGAGMARFRITAKGRRLHSPADPFDGMTLAPDACPRCGDAPAWHKNQTGPCMAIGCKCQGPPTAPTETSSS